MSTKKNTDVQVQADERAYELMRPIIFDGQEITILTLNFDELDGRDMLECVKKARIIDPEESVTAPIRAFTLGYQIAVAAKAANVIPELIQSLKGPDFTQVTQKASNFLLGRG